MLLNKNIQYNQLQNRKENNKPTSFLTFNIGNKLFASNVIKIINNYKIDKINFVSETSGFFTGVIHLNNYTIPVIDIGLRLGVGNIIITKHTHILILPIKIGRKDSLIAVLVDSIHEFIEVSKEKVMLSDNNYVIHKLTGEAFKLLEIKKLLSANELISLQMFQKTYLE